MFEERSPFQKVQIVHSKSLGNMLVLDDLQNISEADLIYTETLMQRGKENYKDKDIVILGNQKLNNSKTFFSCECSFDFVL